MVAATAASNASAASNITYTWTSLSAPVKVNCPGVVVHEGKVYVLGGFTSPSPPYQEPLTDRVWRFDPATSNWTQLTGTLPYGMLLRVCTGVVHEGLYITSPQVGPTGNNGWGTHRKVVEYDLAGTTNGVETADYGYTVWGAEFVRTADGRIYSFGGWTGSGVNKIYRYDPVAKTLTLLPARLQGPGRVGIKGLLDPSGKIVLFGGNQPLPGCRWVEVFDPATEQIVWSGEVLPDDFDPWSRGFLVAWTLNVAGSPVMFVADPSTRKVYRFDPAAKTFTMADFTLPTTAQAPYIEGRGADEATGVLYLTHSVHDGSGGYNTTLWVGTPKVSPELIGGETLLRITGGTLNGTTVTPGDLDGQTITVEAGMRITGTVKISVWRGINPGSVFPVIWTPTWGGVPQAIYRELAANVPASGSATNPTETQFTVNIDLTAPSEGGTEFLVFDTAGEVGSDHVASLSHWEDPTTHWGDTYAPSPNPHPDWGTQIDLATLNDNQYEGLITNRYLSTWWRNKLGQYIEIGNHIGGSTHTGDAIRIVVRGKPKLIGYWDFQDGPGATRLTDRSGNANHGTLTNMDTANAWVQVTDSGLRPSPEYAKNYALQFDGVDDYVTIAHNPELDPGAGDFTLTLWFKASVTQDFSEPYWGLLSKRDTAWWWDDASYWLTIWGTTYYEPSKHLCASIGRVHYDWPNHTTWQRVDTESPVVDDQWHMATMIRRQGVLELWLDGRRQLRSPRWETPIATFENTDPIDIGRDRYGNGIGYFTGLIDEIRLYAGALSPAEIRNLAGNAVTHDFDGDGDVDLRDFTQFQACFNGPNRPAKCSQ